MRWREKSKEEAEKRKRWRQRGGRIIISLATGMTNYGYLLPSKAIIKVTKIWSRKKKMLIYNDSQMRKE